MDKVALILLCAVGVVSAAKAQDVGACAWRQLPAEGHALFLSHYQVNIMDGMAALKDQDAEIRPLVARCAQREDIPPLWIALSVGSQAIQDGAAQQLAADLQISRASLDAAWTAAPEEARACTRANAAKAFGLMNQPCNDRKAPLWFLKALSISRDNSKDVAQLLYYFNAKAQSEWAEAVIEKFKSSQTSKMMTSAWGVIDTSRPSSPVSRSETGEVAQRQAL